MDESSIVASPVESSTPSKTPDMGIGALHKEFNPLYKHFSLEESKASDKALETIWEYAKSQSPSKDKDSIILQVIKFNHEIGSANIGEPVYAKMYRYLQVYRQFKDAGELMKEMKKS